MAKPSRTLLGWEICKALGIDPHNVMSLTLKVEPNALVTVTTTHFIEDGEVLTTLLQEYAVVRRHDEGGKND